MLEAALLFIRVFACLVIVPFGSDLSAAAYRLLLALLITFALSPEPAATAAHIDVSAIVTNALVGLLLGLPLALLVHVAEWVGELFDVHRGQMLGSILDPSQSSSSIAAFTSGVAMRAIIFCAGFLPDLCHAILESLHNFPLTGLGPRSWREQGLTLMFETAGFCSLALRLSAPFAVVFGLLEVAFAFAAKLAPSISWHSEVFLLKFGLGFWLASWIAEHQHISTVVAFSRPERFLGQGP